MAVYSQTFRHLPALLEEVELSSLYENTTQAKPAWCGLRNRLTWLKHRHYLAKQLANFRLCTVASQREKELLLSSVKPTQRVEVVPNSVDLQQYGVVKTLKQANSLIFAGAFTFAPNYAAMCWFIQEVLPHVRAAVPGVRLTITGNHAGKPLPTVEGITLTGHVDDIGSLVSSATASIAPIHSGGGTRLKILEAMALRTPVVATSKGAEGLNVVDGKHLLIADTPQEFASAILSLLHSPQLQHELAENGYQLIRTQYDSAVIVPAFLNLVQQVAQC
jgi:polysaccharide biosynthesis protein PslH